MLRYDLQAGDELLYELRESTTSLDNEIVRHELTARIQFWCLQRDGDDMLVLVALSTSAAGATGPLQGGVLHIAESGQRRWPRGMAARLPVLDRALELLPLLPLAVQQEHAWTTTADVCGRRRQCVNRGPDPQNDGALRITYRVEEPAGIDELTGRSCAGAYWFDPQAGVVTRVQSALEDRRLGTRMRLVARLRQRTRNSAQWCVRRNSEAVAFVRSIAHAEQLLHALVIRPAELAHTFRLLDRLWAAFRSEADQHGGSPFARIADGERLALRDRQATLLARAELGRRWMERPAAPWSLQDPGGQTHTSEVLRDGVVIEVFWSADAIWALRGLGAVRHLQSELGRSPIRILCYNMDADLVRASEAIRHCGADLVQLLGGPLLLAEPLAELPVVRLLDDEGVVRDMWVGWQPDYDAARDAALKLADWQAALRARPAK